MGNRSLRLAVAISFALLSTAIAQQPKPDAARVEKLLSQMTLDEKITLLGGVDSMHTRPIERLGIRRIRMSDGPNGAHNYGESTAYPAGVLLAATWDPELAKREGEQLGRDARARGCNVLLAPAINIYRHPRNGRNFEYFGEDPLLAGEVGAGYVNGLQSQGVSATVKHFAANSQETDRMGSTSEIDERTLREIYLPAFKRIIDKSHPGAFMCSYNRLNGTYTSAHHWLLTELLRDEWKYDGIVMSDWGAVHGAMGPLLAGLDLEMPGPEHFKLDAVKTLVANGVVPESVIDTKVRRLLSWMDRFGWLDKDITDKSIPRENPEGAKTALDVARAGITLLKNENGLLPLDKSKLKKVVLLGPNAEKTPIGGGGSGYTVPFRSVSIAEGLRTALGRERVNVIVSDPYTKLVVAPIIDGGAFQAEYFAGTKLEGKAAIKREEKTIDFKAASGADISAIDGMQPGNFSIRYRGTITPTKDETFTFYARSDDGVRVILDGKTIIDDWNDHGARVRTETLGMKAGQKYELVVEYYDRGGEALLQFGCGPLPESFTPADLAAIRSADAVIVCAGFSDQNEGEGSDRSYTLVDNQSELIQRAASENPKTLVVFNGGGSADFSPWIDRVQGFVHAYYMGQEGGTALADVLLGEVNPSGRLPFTIEKKLEDIPSQGHFGNEGVVEYAEGLFVGYRGYDAKKIEPRFPFGFGLSYTTFSIGKVDAKAEGDSIVVRAELSNTGSRDGASVAQCYVELPKTDLPRPVRELKGFKKVQVKQGAREAVEIRIPRSDLAVWDVKTHAWKVTPGEYRFSVGQHSRDVSQSASVNIK
jgi:beta-glucosidase